MEEGRKERGRMSVFLFDDQVANLTNHKDGGRNCTHFVVHLRVSACSCVSE